MSALRNAVWLNRYLHWEEVVMHRFNRAHACRRLRGFFAVCSRLGDGVAWYALAAAIALGFGHPAWAPMGVMLLSAGVGLLIYWSIKKVTARPRPLHSHDGIAHSVAPLDKYSFPSGHTLHAVNFAAQIVLFAPPLGWLVIPFAVCVALSRLVLGLHYLSDVLVGALIGALLAWVSYGIWG